MINIEDLKKDWTAEENFPFHGWDFSHLDGRWESSDLRWDYKRIILSAINPSDNLLDMGTGDGQFLLSLNHPHKNTSITESYPPNLEICKEKLSPLGIDVRQIFTETEIPFDDNTFDVVINRHETFDIKEVRRVLKNNGLFITQQVGGKNNQILSKKLIKNFQSKFRYFTLEHTIARLMRNRFEVFLSDEQLAPLKFFDVGAVVYCAKAIKWEFPNFSVNSCFKELVSLQEELDEKGYIESIEHRFIIVANVNK